MICKESNKVGDVLLALLSGTEALSHTGQRWLAEELSTEHQMKLDEA